MQVDWSAHPIRRIVPLSLVLICFVLLTSGPALAGHKLDAPGTSCYDCHSVGGASETTVPNTRLIKRDAKIIEIINNGWQTGNPLPCTYCHDDTPKSVRENMAGVKDHFSGASLSKHPANPYSPGDGDADPDTLDCINCHDNVTYVGGGNSINPDIHDRDMQGVGYAASTGTLIVDDTFRSYLGTGNPVSPWNGDGNTFCTQQCHDTGHTGFAATKVAHSFTSSTVTLDDIEESGVPAAPTGCIDSTGTDGCHASHKADNNVGLLTIKNDDGSAVERKDCGVCHDFDDGNNWDQHGHGQFTQDRGIDCTSCHDAGDPHFGSDGKMPASNPKMLAFAVSYSNVSDLTGLPTEANCVTSNCHAGYTPHTGDNNIVVGCLDCHEIHGDGIGSNIAMIRENIPVLSGTVVSIVYDTVGAYYSSVAPGNFSNMLCDNESCHGQPQGPGDYATAMSTHPGGSVATGCADCHKHQPSSDGGGGGSWASSGCDTCHGGNGDYWPMTVSTDVAARPDRAGAHPKHLAVLNGNASCGACHPNGGHTGDQDNEPADVHQDGISTTTYLENFQNQDDSNATFDSTTSTCALADCHGETTTPDWYTATPIACNDCHGSGAMGIPATGLHSLHVNTASSAYVDDCNDCHGGNANTGGHGGHWNGTVNVGEQMV